MPLYDKPVRVLMRDMLAGFGLQKREVLTRDASSRGSINATRATTGHTERTPDFDVHERSESSPSQARPEDDVFYQIDSATFSLYEQFRSSANRSGYSSPMASALMKTAH